MARWKTPAILHFTRAGRALGRREGGRRRKVALARTQGAFTTLGTPPAGQGGKAVPVASACSVFGHGTSWRSDKTSHLAARLPGDMRGHGAAPRLHARAPPPRAAFLYLTPVPAAAAASHAQPPGRPGSSMPLDSLQLLCACWLPSFPVWEQYNIPTRLPGGGKGSGPGSCACHSAWGRSNKEGRKERDCAH